MPPFVPPVEEDPRKQRFIDWLVTPPTKREPRNQALLAEEMQLSERTLVKWKTEDDFRQAWQERSLKVVGNPDRAKEVLDSLFLVARDVRARNHVSAAKLYLEAIDAIKPKQINVSVSRDASKLSDDELDALIALGATELKAERDANS
jgi:hypothetical protein